MLELDYEDFYARIKEKMASKKVSTAMKEALLLLDIGKRKVQVRELTEQAEKLAEKVKKGE